MVSINYFRINNFPLSKEDSLNFKVKNGDTLIPVSKETLAEIRGKKTRVPYEPRSKDFLEIYEHIVFGTPDKRESSTLKIWKEPLKLYFDPSVPKAHQKALLRFAKEVSLDVDSLRIFEAEKRDKANFLIFYKNNIDDFDLEPRISDKRKAGFYLNWNDKQRLTRGVLKVNTFHVPGAKDQLDLLKYYFFRSLGYFYFSPKLPCESYLSACPVKRELTQEDLDILKYHYSYGIAKGVDIKTFRRIHKEYQELTDKYPDSKHYIVHEN